MAGFSLSWSRCASRQTKAKRGVWKVATATRTATRRFFKSWACGDGPGPWWQASGAIPSARCRSGPLMASTKTSWNSVGRSAGEGGPPTPALRSWSSSVVISPPGAPGRRAAGGDEPAVDRGLRAACVGQQGSQEQQKPRGSEMDRRGGVVAVLVAVGDAASRRRPGS
jgi:hypothetical protein